MTEKEFLMLLMAMTLQTGCRMEKKALDATREKIYSAPSAIYFLKMPSNMPLFVSASLPTLQPYHVSLFSIEASLL